MANTYYCCLFIILIIFYFYIVKIALWNAQNAPDRNIFINFLLGVCVLGGGGGGEGGWHALGSRLHHCESKFLQY